jgi:hypothetical protein
MEAIGMAGDSDEPQAFRIDEDPLQPVGPGPESPPAASFDPTRLDFGHYAGRTLEELARVDPDYLRWLERHPSGVRYRAEIHRVLGVVPYSTDWRR